MKRIAILGGGLAGLTVAFRRSQRGDAVTLFEATDRLGGQISTVREDGFVVELGAEGFVARSEAVPRLADDVRAVAHGAMGAAGTALLDQRQSTSFRFDGSSLAALAPGEAAEALSFQVDRADKGAGIRTFVDGMQTLTDMLGAANGARVDARLGKPPGPIALDGPRVRIGEETFDAVVVATSSVEAAVWLAPLVGDTGFARAETLSNVSVSLAFARGQIGHALDGTGFVVAEPFDGFRACTFTSSKFAYRAPDDAVSLRAFFRPTEAELATETPWAKRAHEVLGKVLPIDGAPSRAWVSRWPNALPVFTEEHREAVRRTEAALAAHPIWLAGSAFHGSGIDAAVRSAEATAARLG